MSRRNMIRCFLSVVLAAAGPAALPATACTSFCFDTPDGPIFGSNLDLRWPDGLIFVNPQGLSKMSYMLNSEGEPARWVSQYGSVTFNLVGIEMPWGGMNEAGLVVGNMQLLLTDYPEADERYPVSSPTWTQYMLDTCADVGEVVAALDSLRLRGDAVHFLVADETGACVIVEYLGGETIIHEGDGLPVRALANAAYRDCLHYMETGIPPEFNPGRSAERVAAADEWAGRYDPAGGTNPMDYALTVLTEVVVDPRRWWKPIFVAPFTRWSVAYDLTGREIRFRTEGHDSVRSFSFANLDFDCNAPRLMMDVNAELEGPVEGALQPYDPEMNYEFAREFLHRWGNQLNDEEIRELTGFLEGFVCVRSD